MKERDIPNFRTSSDFSKLKNFLILVARLGPNRLGRVTSVRPGSSSSPCLTMMQARTYPVVSAPGSTHANRGESLTPMSLPTMQPRTDFLFLSPSRRDR